MIKKITFLFVFINCFFLLSLQAQDFDIIIKTVDKLSEEPVEFANIFIVPCDCGGPTNIDGQFEVKLDKNEYRIITSCIGFQNDTTTINIDQSTTITINLETKGYQLENITVSGQNTRQNIERTVMGVQQLSANKIKTLPTAIGEVDVLRSLTMLPGVGSAGEASNGLSIRGGSLDQNLVLLDNAPIYNPTHLFGLFSVFTPDAVGGVDLYRANMPAKYGGRISSVVDIKVKNPEAQKFTLTGGVGFVSSRVAIETPIIKNKLSVMASTRVSFNDFIFSKIERLKNTTANFWDGTFKIKYQANERNSFFATGFYSHDFYELDITSKIGDITATSNQYDYLTVNGTLNWLHNFGGESFLRTTLVSSNYNPQIFFPQDNSTNLITFKSAINYQSLQSEFINPGSKDKEWSYSGGLQIDRTLLNPGELLPGGDERVEQVILPEEQSYEISAFTNVDWNPTEEIAMSLGLRISSFMLVGPFQKAEYDDLETKENIISQTDYGNGDLVKAYGGLEPRFGMRWKVSENTSLKASYALTRQYLQNIYNSTTPLPTSRWKSSDPYIKPQAGHTYSLGVYRNIKDNKIAVGLEGYYRTIKNVLDYKPGADFFLKKFIEQDVLQGDGKSYGLEFSFEKPEGNINGWLNYTWSRSIRKFYAPEVGDRISNNQWYNSDFDRPHVLNGTVNFVANAYNTFSFNFTYQTGRPYTIPNATFLVDNIPVPIFLERNNSRLPDYHRLDFSWRIHNISTKAKRWKGDWIFTVYNVYNRKNAYNRYFGGKNGLGQKFGDGPLGAYQLAIFNSTIVSLAYSFKFQ